LRNTFINSLINCAEKTDIVLIVGDLGFSVIEPFQKKFPNLFINAGVAEQNMMGLAAGLASEGVRPFVYSIANFPTFRCAEQVRNDVAYHNLPVVIVSVGGGLSYGNMGYSHHAVQDFSLMRSMPNMRIFAPGDPVELDRGFDKLIEYDGPTYLRLGRGGEDNIHSSLNSSIYPGTVLKIVDKQSSRLVLSTGASLKYAVSENHVFFEKDYDVASMPIWGMDLKQEAYNSLKLYSEIIVIEDHLVDGGFGSWILESFNQYSENDTSIKLLGLDPKVTNMVGDQDYLNKVGWGL